MDESRHIFVDGAPCLTHILLKGITLYNCCPPLASIAHHQLDDRELMFSRTVLARHFRSSLTSLSALTHLVISRLYHGRKLKRLSYLHFDFCIYLISDRGST